MQRLTDAARSVVGGSRPLPEPVRAAVALRRPAPGQRLGLDLEGGSTRIMRVEAGSPAADAGVEPGMRIVAVRGKATPTHDSVCELLSNGAGEEEWVRFELVTDCPRSRSWNYARLLAAFPEAVTLGRLTPTDCSSVYREAESDLLQAHALLSGRLLTAPAAASAAPPPEPELEAGVLLPPPAPLQMEAMRVEVKWKAGEKEAGDVLGWYRLSASTWNGALQWHQEGGKGGVLFASRTGKYWMVAGSVEEQERNQGRLRRQREDNVPYSTEGGPWMVHWADAGWRPVNGLEVRPSTHLSLPVPGSKSSGCLSFLPCCSSANLGRDAPG
eukprot:Hpha_TRINITY_DN6922_c0_g1::TRINITY_DN6922_c0_g1_i1::g.139561::m.139561